MKKGEKEKERKKEGVVDFVAFSFRFVFVIDTFDSSRFSGDEFEVFRRSCHMEKSFFTSSSSHTKDRVTENFDYSMWQ